MWFVACVMCFILGMAVQRWLDMRYRQRQAKALLNARQLLAGLPPEDPDFPAEAMDRILKAVRAEEQAMKALQDREEKP